MIKLISPDDIKTSTSYLNQLVDVLQENISGSATRRTYDVFVTSSNDGVNTYAVTSSLFETVYDQSIILSTANEVFDMTVGLYVSGGTTTGSSYAGVDASGKLLFSQNSLMMREKVAMYGEYAQVLLGDNNSQFRSPFVPSATDTTAGIDEAIFLNFKRLFARDKIKPETFAFRFFTTGIIDGSPNASALEKSIVNVFTGTNISRTSTSGSTIFSDVGAASSPQYAFGGQVGNIVQTSNTANNVGLIFYDQGIAVLDAKKVMWGSQHASGTISAVTGTTSFSLSNQTRMGEQNPAVLPRTNPSASFIPDFFVSGSIDDIVDHISSCRFSTGSTTGITFQNITNINSTLVFCRATADEFNYSTNPTATDSDGRIVVIDAGQEDVQRTFSFITSVGLYDAGGDMLAVAKLSRPIEKNDEKDLTVRVSLQF
jgi:hypothetical protein